MEIKLTSHEVGAAVRVGGLRNWQSIRAGLHDAHGYDGDGWGIHIEGAMGEMAAAKALNVYWDGSVNSFKTNDLNGIQVRTRSEHYYDLIVRPEDDNNAIWILVTGKNGIYNVRGWILGRDAKQKEWIQTYGRRPPAHFVPQNKLKSLERLKYDHLL
jgi:hypothetical protein